MNVTEERITRQKAKAFYSGTLTAYNTIDKHVIPVLKNLKEESDTEKAIVGAFFRFHACMHSLVLMNNILDFQAVASCARTAFELLIDIKILSLDSSGDLVKKYHIFPTVERFNSARKLKRFWENNKTNLGDCFLAQREYVESFTERFDKIVAKYWGTDKNNKPKYPKHWTGENLESRVRQLGLKYERNYYELYPKLSWYVHSGSACYAGLEEKDFVATLDLLMQYL
jgi:hypothetical protein